MNLPADRSALLARSWDEAAAGYEAYFVPRCAYPAPAAFGRTGPPHSFAPWVGTAVAALAAGPLPDGPILVPCCGTFPELEPLAELAADRATLLEQQATVAQGDAVTLDERWTGACAAVLSVFGLQQLPDPSAALRSWASALRPGGRLSVMFWPEVPEADGPFVRIERAAGVFTGDDAWERELLPALAEAALSVERHERIAHPITHPDAATFFDAFTRSGPMRTLAATRGPAFVVAMRQAFLAGAPAGRWLHRPEATLIVAGG